RVLAKELGPKKIRVNSINPGGVETEGFHTLGFAGSDFEKQMIAQTPLGRLGQPQDIAPVAAFLASSDSGWITGEIGQCAGGRRWSRSGPGTVFIIRVSRVMRSPGGSMPWAAT